MGSEQAEVAPLEGEMALAPILRGVIGAAIGFAIGVGVAALMGLAGGGEAWLFERSVAFGYMGALTGWLLGVGVWRYWAREWVGQPASHPPHHGVRRYFAFCTDHKVIGVQYLVTFLVFFLLAGLMAMLIRIELARPGETLFNADQYNGVMSLHGIIMVAVAVAAVIGGFGNYLVPLMIGADDMAFPRLNALSFWIVPPVGVMLLLTPLYGGLDAGWTQYAPLSDRGDSAHLFFNLAVITFGFSSILGGLNLLATIIYMRAPGMTWGRMPIFVWSMFAAALISFFFTQGLAAALLMVTLDRVAGMAFFDAARGGDPLLYEHIFWFYSHPAVYVMILPAFGAILEIISHFSRKPLFAYKWAVGGFMGIVGLSGVVWAHHLFTSGMSESLHGPFMVLTEMISIPTGLVFLSALGTIWMGRLWLRTPMLFALAFVFNFAIGGITGIFLADVATDVHLQDSYFVVSHFHYTIVGGEIFGLFAAIYYWFPKITGRMYNERMGQLHFWWMFIGYQLTFIPMFWVGIQGMNRRVADYPAEYGDVNMFISIAAFLLGASFIVWLGNMVYSWIRGPIAEASPWRARTLEWQTSSPPPVENFPVPPRVVGHPYDYGVPGATHALVTPVQT